MVSNISIGSKTEKSASSLLRKRGYWVYNCPRSQTGSQPVDLFAAKCKNSNVRLWFIDGKHVRKNEVSFVLDRIEPNQWASLRYISEYAGMPTKYMGFAVEFERDGNIYWLPYETAVKMAENNEKSINVNKMRLFEEVLNEYDN